MSGKSWQYKIDSIFLWFCCCCSNSGFSVSEMERTWISQFILDKKIKENKLQNNEAFQWTYLPFCLSLLYFRELYWQYGTLVLVSGSNQHALFTNYCACLFHCLTHLSKTKKKRLFLISDDPNSSKTSRKNSRKIASKIAYFTKDKKNILCGLTV